MYGNAAWDVLSAEEKNNYGIFKTIAQSEKSPEGRVGRFIVLDAPDWACVVPVIERGGRRFILAVEQYRHGAQKSMMEFPGGVVEADEAPADAARRELLEETGYAAARIEQLAAYSPNPAFMTNTFYIFAAWGLERVAGQTLDEHELVDIHEIPEDTVRASIGTPPWTHALMTTAAWHYFNRVQPVTP